MRQSHRTTLAEMAQSKNCRESLDRFYEDGFLIVAQAVTPAATSRFHEIMRAVFSRPLEDKIRYESQHPLEPPVAIIKPGYYPFGRYKSHDTGVGNLLEAWALSRSDDGKYWPQNFLDALASLIDYQATLFGVVLCVLKAVERDLHLDEGTLSLLPDPAQDHLHLMHYPSVSEHLQAQAAVRQSEHRDFSLVTAIPQPTTSGLMACDSSKVWHSVDLAEDEVLVIFGTVAERLTAGTLRACLHTVSTDAKSLTTSRYSAPFFILPPRSRTITTLDKFSGRALESQLPPKTIEELEVEIANRIF